MKKIFKIFIAVLLGMSFFTMPVFSEEKPRILDSEGFLYTEEKSAVEKRLEKIYEEHEFNIFAVLLSDSKENAEEYSKRYISENFLNESKGGILLVTDPEKGETFILAFGEKGDVFGDSEMELIYDKTLPYFEDGKYYEGISVFIKYSEDFVSQANESDRSDMAGTGKDLQKIKVIIVAVFVIAGMFAAMLVTNSMKREMATEQIEEAAEKKRLALKNKKDTYLYSEFEID